ncbi:MAG: hypothetical protein ABFR53_08210, partial [Actinomycetota bacterium]
PETLPTTTTTLPTTTTTAPITTTTVDRISEIQAIFEDLEHRRLQAIYDQDEDAFRNMYANDEYLQVELEAFDVVNVMDPNGLSLSVVDVLKDNKSCIAAVVRIDASTAFEGGTSYVATIVLEEVETEWGYSWVGEEWGCDGPHPLSG